jgi:pimeloyl-ACP methyl ester carboxylesterase
LRWVTLWLSEVAVPTLVVVGENDLADFQRIADKLADEIPHTKAAVLLDAGHSAAQLLAGAASDRLVYCHSLWARAVSSAG